MATTIAAGTYKVNATATVWSTKLERRGSYYANSVIKISGGTILNGVPYGIIASGQTKGFEGYTRTFKNPTGCVINAGLLHTTGNVTMGQTSLVVNTNAQMDVWVKTGASCTVWNSPQYRLTAQGTKKSGEKIHIYATVKANDGKTYGYIDTRLTQTIVLYSSGTTLATNLTKTATAQPINRTTPSQQAKNSMSTGTSTMATQTTAPVVTDPTPPTTETIVENNGPSLAERVKQMQFNMIDVDAAEMRSLTNMKSVLGLPPLLPESADPKYINGIDYGRGFAEMFLMNNCIFSILPCKVKYLPGYSDNDKTDFLNLVSSGVSDFGDDAGIIDASNKMGLSGQLFEAVSDYSNYINTVNLLARVFAIYMGIGERTCPGTSTAYKNADYSFYRKFSGARGGGGGLWGTIKNFAGMAGEGLVTKAINDDMYTHFYMTSDGTSMSDSMSVSTVSSSIEGLFNNGLSQLGKDIQFLMGGSLDEGFVRELLDQGESFGSAVSGIPMVGPALGNMVMYGANYLRGGRLVFPQMLDDCTYDRSYTGSCRFISPSGDVEARFLNCMLPLCFLLPYVLPQMLSDNMYTYPFICKVDVPGQVHCDLAAMTGLRIQRGGPEGQSWTMDGLPFEIDVTFDITPLYSKLMVTNTLHPILFMSNTALHEYMASMAGVSFTGDALDIKLKVAAALFNPANIATNNIGSLFRSYYDSGVANALRKVFNF